MSKQKLPNEMEKELLRQIPKNVYAPGVLDLQADVDAVKFEVAEARMKAEALEPNRGCFTIPRDPLTEIYVKYLATMQSEDAKLVCPDCGESDHGNRVNKKPWCMKCNMPLVYKSKRKRGPQVRVIRREKNPTFLEG